MRISLVTPASAGSAKGNWTTAARWATRLEELGHEVAIEQEWSGGGEMLLALHAYRSLASIRRFRLERGPDAPLVVALTGTDVYRDLDRHPEARDALALATRFVTLQPAAIERLPGALRARARVVFQSAVAPSEPEPPSRESFEVCVLANLRDVKDPLRAAAAARLLPVASRVVVLHAGLVLEEALGEQADVASREISRYRWLGPLPHEQALRLLARARLMLLTSQMEGGANVISEAIVCGTPVISSHISGSIGLLGEDYPGYFPVGDERALADLIARAETDVAFLQLLETRCAARAHRFTPESEREAWKQLLDEILG